MKNLELREAILQATRTVKPSAGIDPDDVPKQNLKLVLVGGEKVGKTKLFERLVSDKYEENYLPTIGSDYSKCRRVVPGANVELTVWDTAGRNQYRSILPVYLSKADLVWVLYDVTDRHTFEMVPSLVRIASENVGGQCNMAILGTKIDSWKVPRAVSREEAQELADAIPCHYFEISAVTTQGIEDALQKEIKLALKRLDLLPDWLMAKFDDISSI